MNHINKQDFDKKYFICPASPSLNKNNETGSLGQISYQFIKALSGKLTSTQINAVVFNVLGVNNSRNLKIYPLFSKKTFTAYDSLKFYLLSYFKYIFSSEYKEAKVIHHLLPFTLNTSFNMFFLFKSPDKKYIIGPIIGPHFKGNDYNDEGECYTKNFSISTLVDISIISKLFSKLANIFLLPFHKKTLENADILLFSDKYAYDSYKKILKPGKKYFILPIGSDLKTFKMTKNKIGRRNKIIKVLFVGRLHNRSGCRYLIEAVAKVKKIEPSINIKCKIIGYGPLQNELKDMVKILGVGASVEFLGAIPNNKTPIYYNQADIVCTPALSDTWMTAKEALCCGVPVIITDVCSHSEIIKDGFNGFLVHVKDSDAIAYKLIQLANNRKLLTRLANNAYKESRIKYNWDNIINRYLSILNAKNF